MFNAGSNLLFVSGTLAGQFAFVNVNFSTAAAKQINGSTTVTGVLIADFAVGSQGLIAIISGQLTVTGTLIASQTLTISSSGPGKLNIPGTFHFQGGSGTSVTILGTSLINTLTVDGGTVTLNDNVNIGLAKVAGGATVTMIGALSVNRVFADVSGAGTLSIQGGTNTFHTMSNINSVSLAGGILVADTKQCNVVTFTQTGGNINGSATLSASSATLSNAVINNSPVTATNLNLRGTATINGGSLTVTNLLVISASSQLTLGAGAVFAVTSVAKVSQSAPLQVLPSGTAQTPSFKNDGKWTSTSALTLDTLTTGAGSFEFGSGGSLSATGITLTINSILLTSASFTSIGSRVSVSSIDGTGGTITSQSQTFTVSGTMNVANFVHENGVTSVSTGNIGSLDVQSGTFNVTGSGLKVTNLNFEGGEITSRAQAVTITASATTITGNMPKTLATVTLSSQEITLSCGNQQCELITIAASLVTQ